MKKYLLASCLTLVAVPALAYEPICANIPDTRCGELGFNKSASDCAGKSMLKCPLDASKVFCEDTPATPAVDCSAYTLTSCPTNGTCSSCTSGSTTTYKLDSCNTGYTISGNTCTKNCEVGDIVYSDSTCSSTLDSSKTALGVVFDTENKLAVSLNINNTLRWSKTYQDIEDVTAVECSTKSICGKDARGKCTPIDTITCYPDGKSNTAAIVAAQGNNSDYAAGYCYNLTEGGKTAKSWWLPSMKELKTLYNHKTAVSAGLTAAKATTFVQIESSDPWYWSSVQSGLNNNAWHMDMLDGYVFADLKSLNYINNVTRCITSY